jgi:branched-subunit amino acid aminotransferase/4-amino-4-deoxychorismate lyase
MRCGRRSPLTPDRCDASWQLSSILAHRESCPATVESVQVAPSNRATQATVTMERDGSPATISQIRSLAMTNYGHFTSMLMAAGRVRGLSLHMRRLTADCRRLFGAELDIDHVRWSIRHAVADEAQPRSVRVTIYDPALDPGTIGSDAEPHVLVSTRPALTGRPAVLRLRSVSYRREVPAVKHVGLFGALDHRRAAQRDGFDDVLFVNPDGTVSEIATSNIGFVRDGRIVWPRSDCLAGVTMTLIHQALDAPAGTEPVTLTDLPGMEACFATNAISGIRAVMSVDGTVWPASHQVHGMLRRLYADIPPERV